MKCCSALVFIWLCEENGGLGCPCAVGMKAITEIMTAKEQNCRRANFIFIGFIKLFQASSHFLIKDVATWRIFFKGYMIATTLRINLR
jgi:hypothetical protein